jgi:uncharacterized protein (TIGR03437 family)
LLKTLRFIPFFLIALGIDAQTVRFQTTFGGIDVVLTPTTTPLTVANFMNYVDSGAFSNTIFHRSLSPSAASAAPPYIIQGGGYVLGPANIPVLYGPLNPPVTNEFNSASCPCNILGTLAMALTASSIDSGTNQWYFNLSDNASSFDSGDYTVFGNIANNASLAVANNINALNTWSVDFGQDADFANLPLQNYSCPNPTCPLVQMANYVFVNSIGPITAPTVTAAGVADAATSSNNSKMGISPGEIITLYGSNWNTTTPSYMGPSLPPGQAVTLTLDSAGSVNTNLDGTQVTFNGVPGAMDFTTDEQIAVVVPYEIAGQSTVNVVVSYLGGSSSSMQFNVVPTTPGLFTLNQAGSGDAAIIRLSDASVISASNPASVGDFLELYGEGYGVATPSTSLPDGAVVGSVLPVPAATTVLMIDGQPVATQYAGGAGGDVNGVMQVNFTVPQLAPGSHQIQVKVGSAVSPAGVTLATK